jgi:hypothetical protein
MPHVIGLVVTKITSSRPIVYHAPQVLHPSHMDKAGKLSFLVKAKGIRRGAYGSALWRALAVLTATVIALPALATTAQAAPLRTVTGNAVFQIMDYESVGRNERCRPEVRLTPRAIEVGTFKDIVVRARCGGEIRVEAHYRLENQQDGFICVKHGLVEFYEGDSENTRDLNGARAFSDMFLWPGQGFARNIHVQNWSEGQPDDKADVTLTLRSS